MADNKKYKTSLLLAFRLFFQPGQAQALIILALYLIVSVIPSGILWLNKIVFEQFSANEIDLQFILMLLSGIIALQMIQMIITYAKSLLMTKAQQSIRLIVQKNIHNKICSMHYFELDNPDTRDIMERITNLIPSQSTNVIFILLDVISLVVQIITTSIILFSINSIIPFILVLFSIPYLFLYRSMSFHNYFHEVGQTKDFRKNWYLTKMVFDKHHNKELKYYNLFDYVGEKEKSINTRLHQDSYNLSKKYAVYGMLLDMLRTVSKGICILWLIYLIVRDSLNISALTVLIQAMDGMQSSMLSIFSSFKDFKSAGFYFRDYAKFMDMTEDSDTAALGKDSSRPFIQFKHVSIKYPGCNKFALQDINLSIQKGEKIAVVGQNGSGKTTLVNLLLGIYQPTEGSIYINGADLKTCCRTLREKTVYVMQNIPRYCFSIRDNLELGRTASDCEKTAKLLDIENIIQKAPNGADTLLGVENDNLYDISGGEWARIGITRNQKTDSELYVLDEPTASLDPILESSIYESFEKITGHKTTIFISHRLGIISLVDRIIVMDKGCIAESGTHAELMANKELYYKMYTTQRDLYFGV